jgi:hypothetical protein
MASATVDASLFGMSATSMYLVNASDHFLAQVVFQLAEKAFDLVQ